MEGGEDDILDPEKLINSRETTAFLDHIMNGKEIDKDKIVGDEVGKDNSQENNQVSSSQGQDNKDPDHENEKPLIPDTIPGPDVDIPINVNPITDEKPKEDDRNKKIKEVIEEDKLDKLISYFKKIKNPEIQDLKMNDYDKDYGWFHCGKQNEANGSVCELGKEICPNCMKKTQDLYKLKSHYLINSNGRICTYKKNKIYCLCKMTRIASETKSKENKEIGINYSISYTCGHSGQCEPCKNLTSIMDKYFSPNLMQKLKKRDETELN